MTFTFRMTADFARQMREDLLRAHAYAHERVAFISARPSETGHGLVLLACQYHPVADDDYVPDPAVDAMMSECAVRKAMQIAWRSKCSMIHVHLHEHRGVPGFGRLDMQENGRFMPEFFNVQPLMPHAAIVLSHNAAAGLIWPKRGRGPVPFDEIAEVGLPMIISRRSQ
jgi:hypothetical protein